MRRIPFWSGSRTVLRGPIRPSIPAGRPDRAIASSRRRTVTGRLATLAALAALATVSFTAGPAAAQDAQYYVLDGFGAVHAGDGAPAIVPATPYFGFDIARDIAYIAKGTGGVFGDGVLVLDGFGGVHPGGAAAFDPPGTGTPYFGFDAARAITYRNIPPRVNRTSNSGGTTVTSGTYTSVQSASINAPDDGFLLVVATAKIFCSGSGPAEAAMSLNVDSTSGLAGFDWLERIDDCNPASAGTTFTINYVFSVASGNHVVHLLARDLGNTRNPVFGDRVVSVVFIDQDSVGGS